MKTRKGHCGTEDCEVCTARTLAVGLLVGDWRETVGFTDLSHYPDTEVDEALADLTAAGYLERTVWGDYRLAPWLRAALGEDGSGPNAMRVWEQLAEPVLAAWPGLL